MARHSIGALAFLLAGNVVAGPPDPDALPPGAIARLGSLQGQYEQPKAHAFTDGGRTLLTVYLIADLASEQWTRREGAMKTLARYPDLIEVMLRDALATTRSAEQRKSLRALLESPPALHDPERVRRWRAIVLLERNGTLEARKLLELVAQSPAGSTEGEAARAALRGLTR